MMDAAWEADAQVRAAPENADLKLDRYRAVTANVNATVILTSTRVS